MTDESPWGDGSITITLKAGKGFEVPWIVVKGPDADTVRKHLEEATGLSGEGLTLAQLTYNASYHFQSINTVAHGLDAIVIADEPSAEKSAPTTSSATEAAPSAPAAEATASEPIGHVAMIGKMTARKDLTAYYLAHRADFDGDQELMDELQKRFGAEDVK